MKKLMAGLLIGMMLLGVFLVAPAKAENLSGNKWVDVPMKVLFAPVRILCFWDRYSAAYAKSQRQGNLRFWDGFKGILNMDADYAENLFGNVLNLATFTFSDRDYTTPWEKNGKLSQRVQKSDAANVFKLVAIGTTFGVAIAETPIFAADHVLAQDLWCMYGISETATLMYRAGENWITGE